MDVINTERDPLPVVSKPPRGMDRPRVGDRVVSVNGVDITTRAPDESNLVEFFYEMM